MKLYGTVIEGKQQGRKIGFPTANIINTLKIRPGIYKGTTTFGDQTYLSAIYVGENRPDILETHIINFPETDIYGKNIEVQVQEKIRDEMKEISNDDLKSQIAFDIEKIRLLAQNTSQKYV